MPARIPTLQPIFKVYPDVQSVGNDRVTLWTVQVHLEHDPYRSMVLAETLSQGAAQILADRLTAAMEPIEMLTRAARVLRANLPREPM